MNLRFLWIILSIFALAFFLVQSSNAFAEVSHVTGISSGSSAAEDDRVWFVPIESDFTS